MQSDDQTKAKAKPMRTKKKSEGWREREESSAAGIAPRPMTSDERDEHSLVSC